MKYAYLLTLLPLARLATLCVAAPESLHESGFTAMWWTEGPPHYLSMKGTPPPAVLCLRNGEIGLLIDTKSLRMPHAGRFAVEQAKDAALAAGTRALLELPAAELTMSVVCTGKTFTFSSLKWSQHIIRLPSVVKAAGGRRSRGGLRRLAGPGRTGRPRHPGD